ncbi:hypothetical protein [Streptomyces spectabilis]|uniref:hypothetical protein n=1 Tax=Streptomyces spectabilis TaxID=68270 RepID=UPI001CEFA81B|nr:hypothetical protein [Streptomyces spectabilis]
MPPPVSTCACFPSPAVIVVIGLGDDPAAVESATGHRPLRSFVAALTPGPARIRGERGECVEVTCHPGAYAVLGVSPCELDESVTGASKTCGDGTSDTSASGWPTPRPGRNGSP